MAKIPKAEGIGSPGEVGPIKSPAMQPKKEPDASTFKGYMEQPTAPAGQASGGISPMDLAQKQASSTSPTSESVLAQVNNAQNSLAQMQTNLQMPNLQLKRSQQTLLDGKLTQANDHIVKASNAIGAPILPATKVAKSASPIERFLSYAEDGQNQLHQAQVQLKNMTEGKKQIDPAQMMLIQVKLAQAQQEIEYSSIVLNQAVNALKQMMNIQL